MGRGRGYLGCVCQWGQVGAHLPPSPGPFFPRTVLLAPHPPRIFLVRYTTACLLDNKTSPSTSREQLVDRVFELCLGHVWVSPATHLSSLNLNRLCMRLCSPTLRPVQVKVKNPSLLLQLQRTVPRFPPGEKKHARDCASEVFAMAWSRAVCLLWHGIAQDIFMFTQIIFVRMRLPTETSI